MHFLINYIFRNKPFFLGIILIILIGGIAGFIGAFLIFLLFFLYLKNSRLQFLLITFLVTFFLGDNISGFLSFNNNFRFLILGFGLIYLLKFNILKRNEGMVLLPFTVVALTITFLFSPLGLDALIRSIGFLLVGLVIFKSINKLYTADSNKASDLLILVLFLYFLINAILVFIPTFYLVGRFSGLMNNPNGLGMLGMLSFGIIDLLQKSKNTSFTDRFYLGFKILLFVLVLLTGSRTAMLSIIIYLVVLQVYKNKKFLILVVLMFFPLSYLLYNIDFIAIFNSLGLGESLRTDSLESGSGRMETWMVAWDEVKNQPFFGKGMMYDNYFIDEYRETFIGENQGRHWYGIWSSYLSLLLNVGIVGLIAYLLFLFKCFQMAHNKKLAFAFLILVLASGVTESWMAASMNAFTPLLFLYFAIQAQPNNPYKTS
ncbi:O-antigen ligase [Rhodonellum sp.]|uniref:O-antigen ligase family protein n=1 Tax=Rhodonellum sp. TaxID=2231180 RepID=UPI002727B408|nr:O-antigen ligase family protein [Rhodonellum sp.]MDO9551114.1 O-antigen ligase family protein [Rhodonellum sp.]